MSFKAKSAGNRSNGTAAGWFVLIPIILFCAIPGRVQLWPFLVTGGIVIMAVIAVNLMGSGKAPTAGKTGQADVQDKIARAMRVDAIISVSCPEPECRAKPGHGCLPLIGEGIVDVDPQWNTFAHFRRIERAVKLGAAAKGDVIAQFNHELPKGLDL
jgi:hypothetical protein